MDEVICPKCGARNPDSEFVTLCQHCFASLKGAKRAPKLEEAPSPPTAPAEPPSEPAAIAPSISAPPAPEPPAVSAPEPPTRAEEPAREEAVSDLAEALERKAEVSPPPVPVPRPVEEPTPVPPPPALPVEVPTPVQPAPPPAVEPPTTGVRLLCPKCGAQNPPDRKFCLACGAALFKRPGEAGAVGVREQEKAPWRCPQCGTENPPERVECLRCHFRLASGAEAGTATHRKGTKPPAAVCCGCLGLALFILFLVAIIVARA